MKLLILAGVHGDEPAAVEAARRLARLFRDSEEVEVVPEANPEACFAGTRLSPSDGMDLNRCFPGNEEGTSTERLAFRLFQKVLCARAVVDLHTPSMGRAYLPHARLRVAMPKLRELCSNAGMDYATLEVPEQGMLQVEASQRGIPVLTLEAGEGGKAGEEAVNALVKAVLGVARSLGVADEKPPSAERMRRIYERSVEIIRAYGLDPFKTKAGFMRGGAIFALKEVWKETVKEG